MVMTRKTTTSKMTRNQILDFDDIVWEKFASICFNFLTDIFHILSDYLALYFHFRDDATYQKIINDAENDILKELHVAHQGTERTKRRARIRFIGPTLTKT